MIFINSDGLIGDALSTLPVIDALSAIEPVYVGNARPDILALLQRRNKQVFTIHDTPGMGRQKRDVLFSNSSMAFNYQSSLHMTQAHFAVLGLAVPPTPIPPPIIIPTQTQEVYDYVIAPFSRSDHQNNKVWLLDRWAIALEHLRSQGRTVAILGSHKYDPQPFDNVDYIYDQSFDTVGQLMRAANVVVTADNGMGHFAAAVGARHALLCGNAISPCWVGYTPESIAIYGRPVDWTVDQVVSILEKLV